MAISLEQYIAEATNAYKPAQTAVQTQLDALPGQLQAATESINRGYAQQQSELNSQRNAAATSASLQAAGSGGSFGGAANLANRRYYNQTFVPAQTRLQTNQSNDLATTRKDYENQKTNLNSQLASIEAQAKQSALTNYYAALEAERQREFEARQAELNRQAQLQAQREQNDYMKYVMEAQKNANQSNNKLWDFGNGYTLIQGDDGRAYYKRNGNQISAAAFLAGTSGNSNKWNLWNDVWNNGVNTYGVGSDTVERFGQGLIRAKGLSNYVDLTQL